MRYAPIEGLRAWLAWVVVVGHVINLAGLNLHGGLGTAIGHLPSVAVSVFICISGFVIAHLIVTREEAYLPYIVRRIFRIFPAYLVMSAVGAGTIFLAVAALPHMPWASDPLFTYGQEARDTLASQVKYLWVHIGLHATLLQGLVPDTVLPFSERVFVPPSWSLTLEWQFYLIAPLWVALIRRKSTAVIGVLLAVVAVLVFEYFLKAHGYYRLPSFLPGKALYFLLGIVTRLTAKELTSLIRYPLAAMAGVAALCAIAPEATPYGLWLVFLCYLFGHEHAEKGLDKLVRTVGDWAFASKPATFLGARAYGVYIVHWPMLELSSWLVMTRLHLPQVQSAVVVGALTLTLTLVTSEILHRVVELPMIKLGGRVARRMGPQAAPQSTSA